MHRHADIYRQPDSGTDGQRQVSIDRSTGR